MHGLYKKLLEISAKYTLCVPNQVRVEEHEGEQSCLQHHTLSTLLKKDILLHFGRILKADAVLLLGITPRWIANDRQLRSLPNYPPNDASHTRIVRFPPLLVEHSPRQGIGERALVRETPLLAKKDRVHPEYILIQRPPNRNF